MKYSSTCMRRMEHPDYFGTFVLYQLCLAEFQQRKSMKTGI